MSASDTPSAACTATMLPEPPSHEPQSAPRAIHESAPISPFITRKATTKPIMMVIDAEKKPSSIRGPSFSTLRMSQRSSMVKTIAYVSEFLSPAYAGFVAAISHVPTVQSSMEMR